MLLEASNISFGYKPPKRIIENVSLTLKQGERVALVGQSGCGKSTLSAILAGLLKPQSGTVTFGGKPLPKRSYNPVQLIFQHPEQAVNPRWRVRKTLFEAWFPDDELLRKTGIEPEWLSRYPSELSGGELQRICIARAVGPLTKFLIADEMSTMLDVITQAQIWEFTLNLAEQNNLGLLVVTHNMELASHICERVIRFDEL